MSDSVVISKELRAELENLISRAPRVYPSDKRDVEEAIQALRASPETASLEGVLSDIEEFFLNADLSKLLTNDYEGGSEIRSKIENGDLRRLAPVQPSAVVSQDAVEWHHVRDWINEEAEDMSKGSLHFKHLFEVCEEDWYGFLRLLAKAFNSHALQLSQPVAPVQGGGVDDSFLLDLLEEIKKVLDWSSEFDFKTRKVALSVLTVMTNLNVAYQSVVALRDRSLTTTQSAPSVGSEWVSVKDQLPPIRRVVLARHDQHMVYLASLRPEGEWWDDKSGVRNPTHWMTIPHLTERQGAKP